jgi:hypothetical protein
MNVEDAYTKNGERGKLCLPFWRWDGPHGRKRLLGPMQTCALFIRVRLAVGPWCSTVGQNKFVGSRPPRLLPVVAPSKPSASIEGSNLFCSQQVV